MKWLIFGFLATCALFLTIWLMCLVITYYPTMFLIFLIITASCAFGFVFKLEYGGDK